MREAKSSPWTPAQRIGFRFLFAYLILYFFPFPSGSVNPRWLGATFDPLWNRVVDAFAYLIGVQTPHLNNGGSGDSMFFQLKLVCIILAALTVTIIWSILDSHRRDYRTLHSWTRIWLRYVLALCLLTYGSVKVLMVQFEPPSYSRLIQPVGELSPMALLWTFMGSSSLYTTFTGLAEVLSGLLMFSRRTTTLGAGMAFGVMLNVVMLNMSYDVPVKLGSLHLLLLSLVVLGPDMSRLFDFFVLNRPTPPADLRPEFVRRDLTVMAFVAKVILIVSLLLYLSWDTVAQYRQHIATREKAPLPPEGNYAVLSVEPNALAWKTISWKAGSLGIRLKDGTIRRFNVVGDVTKGLATIASPDDKYGGSLKLTLQDDGRGTAAGTIDGQRVAAVLQRRNASDMPLMSRGFHWVSEAPYFHIFENDK